MARHGNMKEVEEEAGYGEVEDEFEEETEYYIDLVLNALPNAKLKREKIYDALVESDFDIDGVIDKFKKEMAKKKANQQPPPPIEPLIDPKITPRKTIEGEKDGRRSSINRKLSMHRKISKDEANEMQIDKNTWNENYPVLKTLE